MKKKRRSSKKILNSSYVGRYYRKNSNAYFLIKYHLLFATYKNKKIFSTPNMQECFTDSIQEYFSEKEIEVIELECRDNYIHLYVNVPPLISPSVLINKIKSLSSSSITQKFPELQDDTIWNKKYLVSTASKLSDETIQIYLKAN